MPQGLAAGVNTTWIGTEGIAASEQDNAKFNCTSPMSTAAQLRAVITNSTNWIVSSVLFVSPNPSRTHVYVSTLQGRYTEAIISNHSGQIVLRKKLTSPNQKIDVHHLTPGQYLLTVIGGAEKVSEKLAITR